MNVCVCVCVCVCTYWWVSSLSTLIKSVKYTVQVPPNAFCLLPVSSSFSVLSLFVQQGNNVDHVPHTLAPKAGRWIDRQMCTNQQTDGLTNHQKTDRCSDS